MQQRQKRTALVLSGGGARGSYQVGALKAIAHIQPDGGMNPFDIICGTSAGALNASMLACESDHYGHAVKRLETHGKSLGLHFGECDWHDAHHCQSIRDKWR